MEQKRPRVLVWNAAVQDGNTQITGGASCVARAAGATPGGSQLPDLCSPGPRCIFASDLGPSKSFLGSYISEFPLGEEAALGIVKQYVNTAGEKSN